MSTISAQSQLNLYKRIRRKLRRIKRLTAGYIKNIPAYKAYRQWRHAITGPLRMARADLLREEHREHKAQQVQAQQAHMAQFFPLYMTQEPTPELHVLSSALPLCGGSPVKVAYPGQFAGYQPIIKRPDVTKMETRRVTTDLAKLARTLMEPEVLPQRVGPTEKEAEFLLDRHFERVEEQDPDATDVRLPRMPKKAG